MLSFFCFFSGLYGGRTSNASMALCVKHLHSMHSNKIIAMRKKPDVAAVEEAALKAALCQNLAEELQSIVPVPAKRLEEVWLHPFQDGDSHVDGELQTLLMDRLPNLNLRTDIGSFKRLIEEMNFSAPVAATPEMEVQLSIDKWALIQKQLDYDCAVFDTWVRKCASISAAQEQAKHEWRLQRRRRCQQAADVFLNGCVTLRVWDRKKVEVGIAELMNTKKHIISKIGCSSEDVHYIVYLNASAMSLIPAAIVTQQIATMAWCLNDQMQSVGLALLPVYTYNRGKLAMEERQLIEKIMNAGNHSCDWNWHLMFTQKPDTRDQRPMIYSGKFIFSSPVEVQKTLSLYIDSTFEILLG